ncbi:MAG: nitroreductase family protein [Myxococcota bacterium]
MELEEVIGRRRTIRYYLPYRPVEREKVEKMLEAARRASCVGNVNNTKAIVIWKEKATPEVMKAITPPLGYQQMQTAPCFILWYNDTSAYTPEHWDGTLKGLAKQRRIGGYGAQQTERQVDLALMPLFKNWERSAVAPLAFLDVGQAVAQATLIAYNEGLGTCCMSSPRLEGLRELLHLPESAVPVCIQSVGYPAESWEAGGQTVKEPFESLFSEMQYGVPFNISPEVEEELKRAKLVQDPAPLPWRDEEFRYMLRALQLQPRPAPALSDE